MHAMEMRGDRRVRLLSVATVFLFLFSLLGLATHEAGDAAAAEQVTAAAEATTRTGTVAIEFRFAVRAASVDTTVAGAGAVDFAAGRAAFTLVTPGRRPVELVIDGETVYQRDPNLPAAPGAKPWTATATGPIGGMPPALAGTGGDPSATLRLLQDEGFLRDVRHDGSDEVGGVQAAKYVGSFEDDELRDRVAEMRPELAAMARTVRFDDTTVAVWVSDDGLVRRVETSMSMKAGEQTFELSSSFDLRDFGVPVRIEVPSDDQVQRPTG